MSKIITPGMFFQTKRNIDITIIGMVTPVLVMKVLMKAHFRKNKNCMCITEPSAANVNKNVNCSKLSTRITTHLPVLSKSFCHPSCCHQCHSFPMSLALSLGVIICACAYITCPAPLRPYCEKWLRYYHHVLLHSASRIECCKNSTK